MTDWGSSLADGAFDPKRIMHAAGRFGHSALLGIRYAAHGADWAELAMDPGPQHRATDGAAPAFGPLATLLDMACGLSLWVAAGRFFPQATLDLRIDRLRDAAPGRTVTARGMCVKMVGDVGFVRGHAWDEDADDPFALATGTFMVTGTW
jgi:acyl-coenzyme A thioesterase PaaI-like protein